MEIKLKQYSKRIKNNNGKVLVFYRWNKTFLSCVVDSTKFGDFSATEIQSYLFIRSIYVSLNSIRLKLNRLYRKGIFQRKLILKERDKGGRSYYLYSFTDYGREFCKELGLFPSVDLQKRLLLVVKEIERRNLN